jgi:hypothetical protein
MAWDLSNYETVDSRIHKFWELFSNGRLETELIAYSDKQYIVKASVWKDINDPFPSAVDYAEETIGSNPVNRTSALENCATSAIGRVLSDIGLSKIGNRPSAIEMGKAERVGEQPIIAAGGPMARAKATEKQIGFAISMLKEISQRLEFSYEDVMKWACEEYKCQTLEDFSMKQISHFIADLQKTKQQGESSMFYNLVRAKKGPDYDPWATPKN